MLSPTSLHRPAMQPTNTAPLFARSSLAYTLRQNARLCLCMLALLQSCSCRGRCTVDQPILIRGPSPLTFWRIAFFSADHHWSSLHVLLLSIPPSLSLPVDSGNSLESAPDACQNMARCRFSSWLVSGGHRPRYLHFAPSHRSLLGSARPPLEHPTPASRGNHTRSVIA